jgi:hypothetical protein
LLILWGGLFYSSDSFVESTMTFVGLEASSIASLHPNNHSTSWKHPVPLYHHERHRLHETYSLGNDDLSLVEAEETDICHDTRSWEVVQLLPCDPSFARQMCSLVKSIS